MADDYSRVSDALKGGADPDMLCMTCPWDRFCIKPPSMTGDEIQKRLDDAKAKDEEARREKELAGEKVGLPATTLLTALTMGGRDRMAEVCPVFALRLKTPDGKHIVDGIKAAMQGGDR